MSPYEAYKDLCRGCTTCKGQGLLASDPEAKPLFMQWEPRRTDVLFVMEAPNKGDTKKGYLSLDDVKTDPTGEFLHELATKQLGWQPVPDMFLTNSVLCLPRYDVKQGRYPVTPRQRRNCNRKRTDAGCHEWLKKLIDDFQPRVVCPLGGIAMEALNDIEPHHWVLSINVGQAKDWYNRKIFPLYHCGGKAFKFRKPEQQHEDWAKLRVFLDGLPPLTAPDIAPKQ